MQNPMLTFMDNRKAKLRKIVLEILFGKEKVYYSPTHFAHLKTGVAEVLARGSGHSNINRTRDPFLETEDAVIFQEVFWDLFLDRIITIGADEANPEFPFFRLHSEAEVNLKRSK